MNPVIETDNLTKKFGNFSAVDSVSLTVEKGEIYGFLGLNGAGKTTTIRMLLGLIKPSTGTIRIFNQDLNSSRKQYLAKIGSIIETPTAYPELSVNENLLLYKKLRKTSNSTDEIINKLKLNKYKDVKAKNLSLGNVQRLGLAKALLHKPELLILDEPSNGLDPEGIVETREMLIDLAKNQSVTVFISSHILSEISIVADKIGIIHEGKLLKEISSSSLKEIEKRILIIDTKNNTHANEVLIGNGNTSEMDDNGKIILSDDFAIKNSDIISTLLVKNEVPPISMTFTEKDLEDYFLKLIHNNVSE